MKLTPSKIGLVVLAFAAIAAGGWFGISALLAKKPVENPRPDPAPIGKSDKTSTPVVKFTDVTNKAGIQFLHVNGAFGMKLLPETMGSGVAIFDFDNDGRPDILFINSRPWPGDKLSEPAPTMKLYHNNGDGTFEDVTEKMGLAIPLYGMGVTVGDFDNDGWTDIYVTAIGGSKLFRNVDGKRFVDVTEEAGVGDGGLWPNVSRADFLRLDKPMPWPTAATFVDYDGDGKLDLFVCHYVTWSPANDLANDFQLAGVGRAYGPPTAFEGTQCRLYRNMDGKHFEDVTEKVGLKIVEPIGATSRLRSVAKSLGLVIFDPDESGWPSLIVANDTERNFLFHNVAGPNGERRFEEIGLRSGVALAGGQARGGMGIDWGEYRPGKWSAVIANFANEPCTFLTQEKNKGLVFTDAALAAGISGPSQNPLKFGTFLFDYDNDGRLDLLVNNGHLEPEIERVQQNQTYAQSPQLYWNTGQKSGCFEPVTTKDAGSDLFAPMVGRGSAFGDLFGKGTLDVVLTANGGPARLLRNDCDLGHHWLRLTLEGDGQHSNRSAIGALVTVQAGDLVQSRVVAGCRGYLSQSEFPLTFGLYNRTKIDKVTIRWPGKDKMVWELTDLAVDKPHTIRQAELK
jgi:hypothetical protein